MSTSTKTKTTEIRMSSKNSTSTQDKKKVENVLMKKCQELELAVNDLSNQNLNLKTELEEMKDFRDSGKLMAQAYKELEKTKMMLEKVFSEGMIPLNLGMMMNMKWKQLLEEAKKDDISLLADVKKKLKEPTPSDNCICLSCMAKRSLSITPHGLATMVKKKYMFSDMITMTASYNFNTYVLSMGDYSMKNNCRILEMKDKKSDKMVLKLKLEDVKPDRKKVMDNLFFKDNLEGFPIKLTDGKVSLDVNMSIAIFVDIMRSSLSEKNMILSCNKQIDYEVKNTQVLNNKCFISMVNNVQDLVKLDLDRMCTKMNDLSDIEEKIILSQAGDKDIYVYIDEEDFLSDKNHVSWERFTEGFKMKLYQLSLPIFRNINFYCQAGRCDMHPSTELMFIKYSVLNCIMIMLTEINIHFFLSFPKEWNQNPTSLGKLSNLTYEFFCDYLVNEEKCIDIYTWVDIFETRHMTLRKTYNANEKKLVSDEIFMFYNDRASDDNNIWKHKKNTISDSEYKNFHKTEMYKAIMTHKVLPEEKRMMVENSCFMKVLLPHLKMLWCGSKRYPSKMYHSMGDLMDLEMEAVKSSLFLFKNDPTLYYVISSENQKFNHISLESFDGCKTMKTSDLLSMNYYNISFYMNVTMVEENISSSHSKSESMGDYLEVTLEEDFENSWQMCENLRETYIKNWEKNLDIPDIWTNMYDLSDLRVKLLAKSKSQMNDPLKKNMYYKKWTDEDQFLYSGSKMIKLKSQWNRNMLCYVNHTNLMFMEFLMMFWLTRDMNHMLEFSLEMNTKECESEINMLYKFLVHYITTHKFSSFSTKPLLKKDVTKFIYDMMKEVYYLMMEGNRKLFLKHLFILYLMYKERKMRILMLRTEMNSMQEVLETIDITEEANLSNNLKEAMELMDTYMSEFPGGLTDKLDQVVLKDEELKNYAMEISCFFRKLNVDHNETMEVRFTTETTESLVRMYQKGTFYYSK